ncbi:7019_t:CDS:2 [Paraglomus brasilianum]|uniref:7019_t:CDS:1 n=1 Tax=Paraglomus brasilianum TaxID=144538 RepID=A0A9N8W8T9_9GLOM|nr:7019_t:CDS:2 [Paraglomus brasilianum]
MGRLVFELLLALLITGLSRFSTIKYKYPTPAHDANQCSGYRLTSISPTDHGLNGSLVLAGNSCNVYGNDISNLALEVTYETDDILHVKIYDVEERQFQVPDYVLPRKRFQGAKNPAYEFSYTDNTFGFVVKRKNNGEVLFNSTGVQMVFEDQFVKFGSQVHDIMNVYGTRDIGSPLRENIYGVHPFYLDLRRSGRSHGVFLRNSHGMDVFLSSTSNTSEIEYRALGGVIDLYFILGGEDGSPKTVIEQYTDIIGKPHMPNYWALGWHQCRWGYKTIEMVKEVVENYKKAEIPLEVMWTDIDYMDQYRDFTFHPINFPLSKVQSFLAELHSQNQKHVLIVDPAIYNGDDYAPYKEGADLDVFIKNRDGSIYYGRVWPGYTAFPDWFAPNTQSWWTRQFQRFLKDVPVDGIWIDMNEPASFCFGSCGTGHPPGEPPGDSPGDPVFGPGVPDYNLLNPPYSIRNGSPYLSSKTVATNATHWNNYTEYQTHNLYGHMEGIATYKTLITINPKTRPFILSRSTFPGSGAYVGHWSGDNWASWPYLYYSIPGILNFQMYGIPYVGADVCGFNESTDEELCNRWHSLGAFYPFARNHNAHNTIAQEPYVWKSVTEATKKALHVRYTLLPYYYTLFAVAHEKGTPVWRALMFEFTDDYETWNIDKQFMIGPAVLVTPVLEAGHVDVEGYFPKGIWYDWYTHDPIYGANWTKVDAPLGHIPVHIRGGSIILTQRPAYTTTESREQPFELIVALDETGHASGEAYLDDGVSLEPVESLRISFRICDKWQVVMTSVGSYKPNAKLEKLIIIGVGLDLVIDDVHVDMDKNAIITF